MSGDAMDAGNTVSDPDRVAPRPARITTKDGVFTAELPPRSVSVWLVH